MIRLVASDMDGTLLDSYRKITQVNVDAIRLAQEEGIEINCGWGPKEVLEEAQKGWLTVQQVFFPVWMAQTEEGKEILRLAEQCGASCRTLQTGDSLCMGNAMIRILHPGTGDYSQDPNGGSLVFEWECDGIRALFTGDLPLEQEEGLLDRVRPCTFLKAAHHGSNGSTSEQFLEKASPKAVWISCGINNRYGHPGEETLERLNQVDSKILRTDQNGEIRIMVKASDVEACAMRGMEKLSSKNIYHQLY